MLKIHHFATKYKSWGEVSTAVVIADSAPAAYEILMLKNPQDDWEFQETLDIVPGAIIINTETLGV